MRISEQQLEFLEFDRVDVSIEESGGDQPYYFFTKDLSETNSSFSLITCASDEREDDYWRIYFLEVDDYEITKFEDLAVLLTAFNKLKRNKNN